MAYSILIVDDSSIVRKVIMKTFGLTSIDVSAFHQAENGKVALDLLRANQVDIVFLDINMPVMNGMEFMENLTGDPALQKTPVVIVSTEGSAERKEELQKLGIKSYLRKPFTPEELVSVIETNLGALNA